jgi:hypothetical protein
LLPAGQYTFDAQGRMVNPPVKPEEPDVPTPPVEPDVPTPPVEPDEPDTPVLPDEPVKDGIISENGGLFYYVNGVLKKGAGLIKLTDDAQQEYYIYVRSNGQLAIGSYWVTTTNDLLAAGKYLFDGNGKYYPPAVEPEQPEQPEQPDVKNGVVRDENGKLYYYVNGVRQTGCGVVQLTDELGLTYYIYVRTSNDQVVTGTYWPTVCNGYLTPASYDWGTDGRYYPASQPTDPEPDPEPEPEPELKNGIFKEGDHYYYYVNGVKKNGGGVYQLVDEEGKTFYIYVRSNGQLATGRYWPTNHNGLLEYKAYDWGTDGRYYPAQ